MADLSLQKQIESHIPITIPAGEHEPYLGWLNEIQRVLVYMVDKQDGMKYLKEFPVPTDGLETDLLRFIEPHKNGIEAAIYPAKTFDLVSDENYNGIYQASATMPAAVFKDGKIYIFPGGGKVSAFGVIAINDLAETIVKSMPAPFGVACVYYVAIQVYKMLLRDDNNAKEMAPVAIIPDLTLTMPTLTRESFTDTITISANPAAPADPAFTADQAAAPSVNAPTVTSPDVDDLAGEQYNKVNPSLDFTNIDAEALDDDIEMLNGQALILQKKIEEATAQMTDEMNRVQTMIQGFQSKVSHSLEQGRLTMTATDSQAQLKLNQELSNAQNKLQAAIEEKRLIFQKYQSELQAIMNENQTKLADFQNKITVWARKNELNTVEFQQTVQFVLSKYQNDISTQLRHYENKLQEVGLNNQTRDSKIQGYLQSINLLTEQFNNAVQAYLRAVQSDRYVPAPVNPEIPGQ